MTCGTNSPKDDACRLGSIGPGGGWIFFVDYHDDYSGFDYLELAPTVISALKWCANDSSRISATETYAAHAIGSGQANTNAMVAASVDASNGSLTGICTSGAAVSAYQYVSPNGTSDWFLGSRGEMMEMRDNLLKKGSITNELFSAGFYWTSTGNWRGPWAWTFDGLVDNQTGGSEYIPSRTSNWGTAPIRAF